jgi:hypothetical protein
MARNGGDNSGAIRDGHGRYLKGIPGGPGRPMGSRNKLSEHFLCDLQEDWEQHGQEVFQIIRKKFPDVYFQCMVKLAQVHRVELDRPGAFDQPRTTEEVLQRPEQRVGPVVRKMFEDFLRKIKRLEDQEVGSAD